jgi:hypothetical protein
MLSGFNSAGHEIGGGLWRPHCCATEAVGLPVDRGGESAFRLPLGDLAEQRPRVKEAIACASPSAPARMGDREERPGRSVHVRRSRST